MAPIQVWATPNGNTQYHEVESRLFSATASSSVSSLARLCLRTTPPDRYTRASSIQKNIPVYDCSVLSLDDPVLQDEWYDILLKGPGVFVLKNMYPDGCIIEEANKALEVIIEREKGKQAGDHFAAGGKK